MVYHLTSQKIVETLVLDSILAPATTRARPKSFRDKKFLFGSEQAEKSVLYTALKSTMTYGIFRFSLRFENRMVTLKHKYKISIRVSNRDIYKNWCIFVKFGRRSPIQPNWYFFKSRLQPDNQGLSGIHRRWAPAVLHILENRQSAVHAHSVVISG